MKINHLIILLSLFGSILSEEEYIILSKNEKKTVTLYSTTDYYIFVPATYDQYGGISLTFSSVYSYNPDKLYTYECSLSSFSYCSNYVKSSYKSRTSFTKTTLKYSIRASLSTTKYICFVVSPSQSISNVDIEVSDDILSEAVGLAIGIILLIIFLPLIICVAIIIVIICCVCKSKPTPIPNPVINQPLYPVNQPPQYVNAPPQYNPPYPYP